MKKFGVMKYPNAPQIGPLTTMPQLTIMSISGKMYSEQIHTVKFSNTVKEQTVT
jgi:hypothetical protein